MNLLITALHRSDKLTQLNLNANSQRRLIESNPNGCLRGGTTLFMVATRDKIAGCWLAWWKLIVWWNARWISLVGLSGRRWSMQCVKCVCAKRFGPTIGCMLGTPCMNEWTIHESDNTSKQYIHNANLRWMLIRWRSWDCATSLNGNIWFDLLNYFG